MSEFLLEEEQWPVALPPALEEASARPNGVRRIEQSAHGLVGQLEQTVPRYDGRDITRAARAAIAMHRGLRERAAPAELERRRDAEAAAEGRLGAVGSRFDTSESRAVDRGSADGGP